MASVYVFVCVCLCVNVVLAQFGFFPNQRREERRFGNPLNNLQNYLPNTQKISSRLTGILHLRPETQNSDRTYIYPFNRPSVSNEGPYYEQYGRPYHSKYNTEQEQYYANQNRYNQPPVYFPNQGPNYQGPIMGIMPDYPQGGFEIETIEVEEITEKVPELIKPDNVPAFGSRNGEDVPDTQSSIRFPDEEPNGKQDIPNIPPPEATELPQLSPVPSNQGFPVRGPAFPPPPDATGLPPLTPVPNDQSALPPLSDQGSSGFGTVSPALPEAMDLPPLTPVAPVPNALQPLITFPDSNSSTEAPGTPVFPPEFPTFKPLPPLTPVFSEMTELPPLTPVPASATDTRNNFQIFHDTCETVDGEVGTCLSVFSCEPYLALLKQSKSNPGLVQLLRKAHCGFEGNDPKVCCPRPGFPSVPPTPGFTTTTTAAPTPTPSQGPQTEDYVTAFPDPPVCGVSNASFSRVVGGVDAKLGDFPWMALLGYKHKRTGAVRWLCGGSLITSRHVLTAAHCINGHEDDLYLVRLGELDLERDDEGATPADFIIKAKIKHEGYSANTYTNDIGILVLEQQVQFTDLIKPICIPRDSELRARSYENYNPIIAGWGDTEFRGPAATRLQALQLPVVGNDFCAQAYSQYKAQVIDDRVLCAGYKKGGKDACQGDSGGPLMQPIWNSQEFTTHFYQIGVVSYGKKCAEVGFPGVYSRVTHFVPWLEKTVIGAA